MKLNTLAAIVVGLAVSQMAQAGLLGSTVDTQYYAYGSPYVGAGSPATFVADGTPQNQFADYYKLTVTDTQVIYDYLAGVTWSESGVSLDSNGLFITNGNLLTFAGASPIVSVTLGEGSVASFALNHVTFNSNQIATDWQGIHFSAGDKVILNVSAVPEPETYAMLLAGLGIMGAVARRKQK